MSETAVEQHPGADAGAITADECPFRSIDGATAPRRDDFQVVIQQSVLDAIHAHGKSNTKVEICGVLIGRLHRDESGPYLLIHASIAGTEAHSNVANVTFTAKTWSHIHEQMDKLYPDERIVGWYHTHPGFDIFLSEMDLFIQRNFFDLPWQVAFVYDPLRGDEGMFVWRNGEPTRELSLVEPNHGEVIAPPPVDDIPEERASRVFAAIVLVFVAVLLVLLIVFEYKSPPPAPSGPFGEIAPKGSTASQWTASL